MKLVNKILVVTAVASVMTACKPDLLDTNPYDKVGSGAMWGNETMCDMGVPHCARQRLHMKCLHKTLWDLPVRPVILRIC